MLIPDLNPFFVRYPYTVNKAHTPVSCDRMQRIERSLEQARMRHALDVRLWTHDGNASSTTLDRVVRL
jgi:hypothetical protein